MATAYFVVPMERTESPTGQPYARRCAMVAWDEFIVGSGGAWKEVECLGNRAVVKVRATPERLDSLQSGTGWFRVPAVGLTAQLKTLSAGQRNALRDQVTAAGYPLAEFQATHPDLGEATVGDVLRFLLRRRRRWRYDAGADDIVFDGPEETPDPLETLDQVD